MERIPISQINNSVSTEPSIDQPMSDMPLLLNDVPIDILRQFDIDHRTLSNEDKTKLNDIYKWLSYDMTDITSGNIMQRLSNLQNRLGGDRTYTKVWNWLRVKQSIGDLTKKQKAMEHGNIWST